MSIDRATEHPKKLTWFEPAFFHLNRKGSKAWRNRVGLWAALFALYISIEAVPRLIPNREPAVIVVRSVLVASLLAMMIFGPQTMRYVEVAPLGIRYIPFFYFIYGPLGFIILLAFAMPMPRPAKATILRRRTPGTEGTVMILSKRYGQPQSIGIANSISLDDLVFVLTAIGVPVEISDS